MFNSAAILEVKISYQQDAWSPIQCEISIGEALNKIKGGACQQAVSTLRQFLNNNEKQKYDENKKRLPGVCFCGTFVDARRKENLKEYNHLVVIDIDKLLGGELQKLKSCFMADEFVYSFWVSPSGNGIKGLVVLKYDFDASRFDVNQCHKAAFVKLTKYFNEKYSVVLDTSGSDIPRLCFLSYDPDLHIKSNIKHFLVYEDDLAVTAKVKKVGSERAVKEGVHEALTTRDCLLNPTGRNNPRQRYRLQSIIKYLSKRNKSITRDYENWYRVALAIANSFTHDVGEKYYLKLCKLDGSKYDETACKNMLLYCYANTKGEINFKTIFYYAKLQGYKSKGEGSPDGCHQENLDEDLSISASTDLAAK